MKAKRNKDMTYEKMSRAMRYHYGCKHQGRKGHLAMVQKKRLYYKWVEILDGVVSLASTPLRKTTNHRKKGAATFPLVEAKKNHFISLQNFHKKCNVKNKQFANTQSPKTIFLFLFSFLIHWTFFVVSWLVCHTFRVSPSSASTAPPAAQRSGWLNKRHFLDAPASLDLKLSKYSQYCQ